VVGPAKEQAQNAVGTSRSGLFDDLIPAKPTIDYHGLAVQLGGYTILEDASSATPVSLVPANALPELVARATRMRYESIAQYIVTALFAAVAPPAALLALAAVLAWIARGFRAAGPSH
jgi:hypothetical protein